MSDRSERYIFYCMVCENMFFCEWRCVVAKCFMLMLLGAYTLGHNISSSLIVDIAQEVHHFGRFKGKYTLNRQMLLIQTLKGYFFINTRFLITNCIQQKSACWSFCFTIIIKYLLVIIYISVYAEGFHTQASEHY